MLVHNIIPALIIFIVFLTIAFAVSHILTGISQRFDVSASGVFRLLANSQQAILIFIGVVLAISKMGYNVSALVAGLGLTGFAVGFALKDAIANLVAGIMLVLYRPVKLGDEVDIAGSKGEIVDINLRYITIRKEDAIDLVPNSLFVSKQVTIFKSSHRVTDNTERNNIEPT